MIFINKIKDNKKSLLQTLSSVYGLNKSKISLAARVFGLFPYIKIEKIDSIKIRKLETFIKLNFITGKELRDIVRRSLRAIAELRNYKAKRLAFGLPCNGQRSRTNARTSKRLCRQQKLFLNSMEINKILGTTAQQDRTSVTRQKLKK